MKKILFIFALTIISITAFAQKYHDAAAFDAYGNVRTIYTDIGNYEFNKDGSLDIKKSTALSNYKKYDITRSSNGYITNIVNDYETQTFSYDNNGKLIMMEVHGNSNYIINYERNSIYQTETTKMLSGPSQISSIKYHLKYQGKNWVQKKVGYDSSDKGIYRFVTSWDGYEKLMSSNLGSDITSISIFIESPLFISGYPFFQKYSDLKKTLSKEKMKLGEWNNDMSIINCPKTYKGLRLMPIVSKPEYNFSAVNQYALCINPQYVNYDKGQEFNDYRSDIGCETIAGIIIEELSAQGVNMVLDFLDTETVAMKFLYKKHTGFVYSNFLKMKFDSFGWKNNNPNM